ncbi:MAG: MbnP family copper-binding protein, partial [Elainella sp.]
SQSVTIRFAAQVGNQPFTCGKSYELGQPALSIMPSDFRLYVSNVALINQQGEAIPMTLIQDGQWQYQNVALLDFEDKTGACTNGTAETRTEVIGTVPVGTYRGLQFTLGLPFALNHADSTLAASPLNLTSLWWNWRAGYKFARIDLTRMTQANVAPVPGNVPELHHTGQVAHGLAHGATPPAGHGTEQGTGHGGAAEKSGAVSIHLGSTGCEAASTNQSPIQCQNPNTAQIRFAAFDPAQNRVVADLGALLAEANLGVNQPDTPLGCMSSPDDGDCASILHNLGLPFGGQPSPGQTFFRVE